MRSGELHSVDHSYYPQSHIGSPLGNVRNAVVLDTPIAPSPASHSDKATDILAYAVRSVEAGVRTALVTLIEIRGGSARPLGAQMVVREDGLYCGYVSGGCTEAAVAAEAIAALGKGSDRMLLLGEGSPFFDIILPCGGGITLAIHLLRDSKAVSTALDKLAARQPVALLYSAAAQRLDIAQEPVETGQYGESFAISYRPCPQLMIHGGSLEAAAVERLAKAAGYSVWHRNDAAASAPSIDRDTAVVILYHDIDRERPVLEAALKANPFYIGALGSTRTHERRCASLRQLGYNQSDLDRIKAPIGIFPKARSADSLALSIVADIAASRIA
ncbi:XdhC family protein [Oryzifoliimicrobium ureilyticus]|uniref:XdhC family protein n=1 Tax=Oryzifoliimicrobium ureilyticus TaxID=3113724 RepID=UPI0030765377